MRTLGESGYIWGYDSPKCGVLSNYQMKLTDLAIKAAKPRDKPFKLSDSPGLFLLVNPGGSKLWRWRYRFDRKEKLMALGTYPIVGLVHARELHLGGRKTLSAGIDPMAERKAKFETKQSNVEARQRKMESSFENVAHKWWDRWSAGKPPRHAETVMRCLEVDVFPVYGHKCIEEVTVADIWQVMSAAERREGRDIAKDTHEITSRIFRFAVIHGIASKSTTQVIDVRFPLNRPHRSS